jgi:MoaA/NifB/PqqE/SkfB family radical SAM enzyme
MRWLADQNEPQVEFTGGEPFTRPDMPEIIRAALQLGIKVNLSTNGWYLAEHIPEELSGLHRVAVTFYGMESDHDRLVGVEGAHQRAFQALRNLQGRVANLRANVVMQASHLSGLPGLAQQLAASGLDEIKFSQFLPEGRGRRRTGELLTSAQISWLVSELSAMQLCVRLQVQKFDDHATRCALPKCSDLCLAADGSLHPCVYFMHRGVKSFARLSAGSSPEDVLSHYDWESVLAVHAAAPPGSCPALFALPRPLPPGVLLHPGCPPFLERVADAVLA